MKIEMYDIVIINDTTMGTRGSMDVGIVVAIQYKAGYSKPLYQIRDGWYNEDAIKRVLGNAAVLKEEIDMESEQ